MDNIWEDGVAIPVMRIVKVDPIEVGHEDAAAFNIWIEGMDKPVYMVYTNEQKARQVRSELLKKINNYWTI